MQPIDFANDKAGPRPATQAEIHAQQHKAHQDAADRHAKASSFLNEHPEFAVFLELLKAGVFV